MDYQLQQLEKKSIYIIREAREKFKNLAILKSDSKDSKVCLYLCQKAFFGTIPFPILQLNEIEAIKKAIEDYNLEALIVSTKILDSLPDFKDSNCLRICPLSDWAESDLWNYIKENNISLEPSDEKRKLQMVDSKDDKASVEKEDVMKRLRELGYM